MVNEKLVYAVANYIHQRKINERIGKRLPYKGERLETVRHVRFRNPLIEERRGKVYLVRIRANIPDEGNRSIEVFGPVNRASYRNATHEPEKHWPLVDGVVWFGIARGIWTERLQTYKLQHIDGRLAPPEKCDLTAFGIADALRIGVVQPSRYQQPPHISDYFEARALVAELGQTEEGRTRLAALEEMAPLADALRELQATLALLDLGLGLRQRAAQA